MHEGRVIAIHARWYLDPNQVALHRFERNDKLRWGGEHLIVWEGVWSGIGGMVSRESKSKCR